VQSALCARTAFNRCRTYQIRSASSAWGSPRRNILRGWPRPVVLCRRFGISRRVRGRAPTCVTLSSEDLQRVCGCGRNCDECPFAKQGHLECGWFVDSSVVNFRRHPRVGACFCHANDPLGQNGPAMSADGLFWSRRRRACGLTNVAADEHFWIARCARIVDVLAAELRR